jgi:hypothetical protein
MAEIPQRMAHETDLQRKLSRLSARHRRELRELMGNPPDINRVPSGFWDKVKREREAALLILLLMITTDSQKLHVEQLLPDAFHLDVEDGMSRVAREWSGVRADAVARSNVVTAQRRLATRAEYWRRFGGDVPTEQIESDLAGVLGPQIDSVTASTETTRAQTAGVNGAIGAAQAFGIPVRTRWYTRADDRVCPVCAPLHKKHVDLWETVLRNIVAPGGSRAIQEILANGGPPAHGACRCYLITAPEAPARRVRTGILASGAGEMRESFDPSEHPRHGSGSSQGGEFAPKSGGQTSSKEFKAWFGDSKVVDDKGEPLVVYHGTPVPGFAEFSNEKAGNNTGNQAEDVAFHFSDSKKAANYYADVGGPSGGVLPVFLQMKNPMYSDEKVISKFEIDFAKEFGHDGIIARKATKTGVEYIVFNPNQIKSATGNRGTFDPKSNKITEAHEPGWKKAKPPELPVEEPNPWAEVY